MWCITTTSAYLSGVSFVEFGQWRTLRSSAQPKQKYNSNTLLILVRILRVSFWWYGIKWDVWVWANLVCFPYWQLVYSCHWKVFLVDLLICNDNDYSIREWFYGFRNMVSFLMTYKNTSITILIEIIFLLTFF